jgi:hypothetical protein
MDSILISIKKMLGISKEYDAFDAVLIMHINTVFMNLHQLGVGPTKGFSIIDEGDKWSDFIPEDLRLESIKSYMYLKVKLLFDPPMNSAVMDSMTLQIKELEWRLNVTAENNTEITE